MSIHQYPHAQVQINTRCLLQPSLSQAPCSASPREAEITLPLSWGLTLFTENSQLTVS